MWLILYGIMDPAEVLRKSIVVANLAKHPERRLCGARIYDRFAPGLAIMYRRYPRSADCDGFQKHKGVLHPGKVQIPTLHQPRYFHQIGRITHVRQLGLTDLGAAM